MRKGWKWVDDVTQQEHRNNKCYTLTFRYIYIYIYISTYTKLWGKKTHTHEGIELYPQWRAESCDETFVDKYS